MNTLIKRSKNSDVSEDRHVQAEIVACPVRVKAGKVIGKKGVVINLNKSKNSI